MTRRRKLARLAIGALCAAGSGLADAATAGASDLGRGYVATIAGRCEELVIGSRIIPTCGDTLLNVDFANGRVAFVFAGRVDDQVVLTIVSGGRSTQPDARTYELTIDRMTTATLGNGTARAAVVTPAEGTCSMRGDPTREPARFECRVRSAGRETIGRFRSQGSPTDTALTAEIEAIAPTTFGAGRID